MKSIRIASFILLVMAWLASGSRSVRADDDMYACDGSCQVPLPCCLVNTSQPLWDTCEKYCNVCHPGYSDFGGSACEGFAFGNDQGPGTVCDCG